MKKVFLEIIKKILGQLKIIFILLLVLMLTNGRVNAQNEFNVITNKWLQYSDAPNSLYHFLTGEAFELLESRVNKIAQIETKAELLQRQAELSKTMWNVLGPFSGKTSLNAKITAKIKENGYTVENVIYESLPGFYVTASLFIPDDLEKPTPAILFCCGHSTGVYRLPSYQKPLLNLVKKGFIVLAIDPIGQGERIQYFNPETGKSDIGSSTKEHSYPSVQVALLGKSIARYFIWDGIRGIDYLVSRKEVDPNRIGVHGLSGGGTQAAYISALDARVAASAPAGYITSYKRLMESVGVQDGEQNFYHGISSGIDHADYLEVRAPKPTLIMATTRDFFSIQGARESYTEAKRLYGIFGKPNNIEITEDDFGHGYTKKNREAMYAFFQKYLRLPGKSTEEDVDFLTAKELQKTSTGQLSTSLGGGTVFSINREEAIDLINKLQLSRGDLDSHLPRVLNSAKKLSGYIEPSVINKPVFTGRYQREGYVIEKYFVKGEGDYVIPYLLMKPENSNNKAIIYIHPSGKSAEASIGGELEWFVKKGFTVLAPDIIGTGEMGPGSFMGDAYIKGISYGMWYTSMLIGRSIVGIQAGDVVRLTQLLQKAGSIKEIYALAKGEMDPLVIYAAAFNQSITRIALVEPYSSYSSIVLNRFYNPKFVKSIVPGALTAYDLPDLAASLAPRKLLMVGVTDGNGKKIDIKSINNDLNIIRIAYQNKDVMDNLKIISDKSDKELYKLYNNWIK